MGLDDLVCAVCSGRVSDGRCPTCRAARQRMQGPVLPPQLVVALALLLALVAALALSARF